MGYLLPSLSSLPTSLHHPSLLPSLPFSLLSSLLTSIFNLQSSIFNLQSSIVFRRFACCFFPLSLLASFVHFAHFVHSPFLFASFPSSLPFFPSLLSPQS